MAICPYSAMGHKAGMTKRLLLAALSALVLSPAFAAPPKRPVATVVAPLPDVVRVALTIEVGTIVLDLDHKNAPLTVENFVRYVDQKRFDGIVFYRVMRLPWGEQPNGLIQAGARGDPKRVLKPVAHEPTSQTGILHKAGTISMARLAPGTATADFSIMVADMPGLDAGKNPNDPAGYAAFGQVVEGMDVVRKIYDLPLDPVKGEGFMKGQFLAKELKVVSVRRVTIPATPISAPAPAQP
jgi:peptidyl-prolyl cis-trans isomerase A (cyclophilin A)